MTKIALARAVAIDVRSVTAYESGEYAPEIATLRRIAFALNFPSAFFFGDDLKELSTGSASFRSLSRMTAGQRDMALGTGALALALNQWIEVRFKLPQPQVPDLGRSSSPSSAARELREAWGIGTAPIRNIVHLLEARGIRVFSISVDATEVDAFSVWRSDQPFVFLNTKKSAEHSRFDAAHELGHLVMHRHGAPIGTDAEREANAFASEFLMPASSIRDHIGSLYLATVDNLVRWKKIWNVSVAALAYRLQSLGFISEWHARGLFIEISKRGYRDKEPDESPRETSQLLSKILEALKAEGLSSSAIADQLAITRQQFDQLIFGLTENSAERPHPQLRIVK